MYQYFCKSEYVFYCLYLQDGAGHWRWWFWGYEETYALTLRCWSIQAQYTFLMPYLTETTQARYELYYLQELMKFLHTFHKIINILVAAH